jgi:hypothetical protein
MRRWTGLSVVSLLLVTGNSFTAAVASGFGTPVGRVGPCPATSFDRSTLPLIVMLLRGGAPYAWYNISSDRGTDWYHFDVPAGRYQLVSTFTGTRSKSVIVKTGTSPRTDLMISCPVPRR